MYDIVCLFRHGSSTHSISLDAVPTLSETVSTGFALPDDDEHMVADGLD
jgi:hypothetical protein